ncbi:MAG: imidazole glycerol phosphate synthase subunit HisH, partial [Candidatus Altarchaeaceae archaeon]
MEILIINYGAGNLRSVRNAFESLNVNTKIINIENFEKEKIKNADAIVLPGVGNFKNLAEKIKGKENFFKNLKIPFLGICLGLQILFEESEEAENEKGLGILKGKCLKFKNLNLKVPHIGWNKINVIKEHEILENLNGKFFYFVHSYHAPLDNNEFVYAITNYGIDFPSVIIKENF